MPDHLKMLPSSPLPAAPGADNAPVSPLKRKRSQSNASDTAQDAPPATRIREGTTDNTPGVSQNSSSDKSPSTAPTEPDQIATPRKMDPGKLRDTLDAQLSLEVLLKHNELRLIDQEIAKCQVALEQLRRCAEIPYPGSSAAGISQSVSSGEGLAVLPGNGPAPLSPAPWGVTDGPYTRHYSKWLLPDPRFDGGELAGATPSTAGAGPPVIEGRATRGNPIDSGAFSQSRPHRGSVGAKLQSLPNGYPLPKEKAGPMIIRRKSDGILVKLVCLDCRRDNFSSTQGFINHCRIAHNRNFASHDAAATASGEPVEVDEAGAVVGSNSETQIGVAQGYVHPLVRSAHAIEPQPSEESQVSAVETPGPVSPRKRGPLKANGADPFTASPDAPHLSTLMQGKGVGLDLGQLVGEAKTVFDLGAYSSGEESDEDVAQPHTETAQEGQTSGVRAGRQPMRTTVPQGASQRPSSRKALEKPRHKPGQQALTPSPTDSYSSPPDNRTSLPEHTQSEQPDVDGNPSSSFSPNIMELNPAPSLISDDDYEQAMDSESPGPSSSEPGDHEHDFSHINVEDGEATASTATTDSKTEELPAFTKSFRRGSATQNGLASSSVPMNRSKDAKHVSFVSPEDTPSRKKGSRGPSRGR